jgi:hypothetical protein
VYDFGVDGVCAVIEVAAKLSGQRDADRGRRSRSRVGQHEAFAVEPSMGLFHVVDRRHQRGRVWSARRVRDSARDEHPRGALSGGEVEVEQPTHSSVTTRGPVDLQCQLAGIGVEQVVHRVAASIGRGEKVVALQVAQQRADGALVDISQDRSGRSVSVWARMETEESERRGCLRRQAPVGPGEDGPHRCIAVTVGVEGIEPLPLIGELGQDGADRVRPRDSGGSHPQCQRQPGALLLQLIAVGPVPGWFAGDDELCCFRCAHQADTDAMSSLPGDQPVEGIAASDHRQR